MKSKRKWGIVVLVLGIIFMLGSFYVKSQVEAGQKKITSAEKQTGWGEDILSLNPATKELGKGLTGSIQEKVSEGKEQVKFYTSVANWLEVGGIVFIILGFGLIFLGKKTKS
ncbi:MAG: hypothetical protein V4489_00395 [Chlamydiota bacterium]